MSFRTSMVNLNPAVRCTAAMWMVITELWQDQAALDQHMQTEHAIKYVPVLKSCVVNGELHVQAIVSDEVHHSIV